MLNVEPIFTMSRTETFITEPTIVKPWTLHAEPHLLKLRTESELPKFVKSKTLIALPTLIELLRETDEPSCKWSQSDIELVKKIFVAGLVPATLIELEHFNNDLSDMEEPNAIKSRTLKFLPKCPNERTDTDDPMLT
jgi:hypothetical protein